MAGDKSHNLRPYQYEPKRRSLDSANAGKRRRLSSDSEEQWDGVDVETEGWRLDC